MVTLSAPAADNPSVWWVWLLGGVVVWFGVAVLLGMLFGASIRRADLQELGASAPLPVPVVTGPRAVSAPKARRRALPVPTFGLVLFGVAVALETAGYLARLTGATGSTARLLSMDAPGSLPRLFVAALFAAAALAAVAGAGSIPGRRTWWLAIGAVAGTIAAVKAGATVHVDGMRLAADVVGGTGALVLSAAAALAVLGGLWFLSRTERRDRRRMLTVFGLYAGAAVGLSAVSSVVAGAYGSASTLAATATFLEESGEALAGVSFLIAVLVGVAPRVALPAAWALRRSADAHTLELPEALPTAAERPVSS